VIHAIELHRLSYDGPIRVRLGRNRALTLSSSDEAMTIHRTRAITTKSCISTRLHRTRNKNPPALSRGMGRGMSGRLCGACEYALHLDSGPFTAARCWRPFSIERIGNRPECHSALPLLLLNQGKHIGPVLRSALLARL
jgi:hypothetical protein